MASPFSRGALDLAASVTHGTKAAIDAINANLAPADRVIDLSIGTLDTVADTRIDRAVRDFVAYDAETVHAFAPVKGFPSLRAAIAARTQRLHDAAFDPTSEIIVTPGGIKGALTITFHAFLDPGDEVIVPVPNWPHYGDMIKLHGGVPRFVVSNDAQFGLTPEALRRALSPRTKLVILGDCINPTGKVYTTRELEELALVLVEHNRIRDARGLPRVHVVFDCPYEAHVTGPRAKTFAAIDGMRELTITVTGPGKTYGMHGDRIGYALACRAIVAMLERVQVNVNSFASTYGQAATEAALQPDMDRVARERASGARTNLEAMLRRLRAIPSVRVDSPQGGYFLFVDFSAYAAMFDASGYASADAYFLREARVATIGGDYFAEGVPEFRHYVRINCGRTAELLEQASHRISRALAQRVAA